MCFGEKTSEYYHLPGIFDEEFRVINNNKYSVRYVVIVYLIF